MPTITRKTATKAPAKVARKVRSPKPTDKVKISLVKAQKKVTRKAAKPTTTLTLHRTFNEGSAVYVIAMDGKVSDYSGEGLDKLLTEIEGAVTIRVTSIGFFLPVLKYLQDRGANIVTAPWHSTGIAKGLEPKEIAAAFAELDPALMREVHLRADLNSLRNLVTARISLMGYRKSCNMRLLALTRAEDIAKRQPGESKDDWRSRLPTWLASSISEMEEVESEGESPLVKEIAKEAALIPECQILNRVLGVKGSWGTSATVMAYLGDMSRFGAVSSLWHYCGFHVVDGVAPKRRRGNPVTWNPTLRTALWQWADSMLKTKNVIWRPVYDAYLAEEKAVHATKCQCKTPDGHSGARARRRVIKDVLKQFYVAVNGETK